jgi:hypothetical protein
MAATKSKMIADVRNAASRKTAIKKYIVLCLKAENETPEACA